MLSKSICVTFSMSAIIRDLRMSSLSLTNQRIVTKGPFTNPNASADCLTSTSAPPDPLPSRIALLSVEWHKPQRCLSIASRIHCAWPLFVTPSPTTEPSPYPDFVQTYFLTTRAIFSTQFRDPARSACIYPPVHCPSPTTHCC